MFKCGDGIKILVHIGAKDRLKIGLFFTNLMNNDLK